MIDVEGRVWAIDGNKDARNHVVCFDLYIYSSSVDWDLQEDLNSWYSGRP